jgi:hypothetical protein
LKKFIDEEGGGEAKYMYLNKNIQPGIEGIPLFVACY